MKVRPFARPTVDEAVARWMGQQFQAATGVDVWRPAGTRERLYRTAEKAIEGLKVKRTVHIVVRSLYEDAGGPKDLDVRLTRDQLAELQLSSKDELQENAVAWAITDWIVVGFKNKEGVDLEPDQLAIHRLFEAAKAASSELSSRAVTEIDVPFITASSVGPVHLRLALTRAEYEELRASSLAAHSEELTGKQRDESTWPGPERSSSTRRPPILALGDGTLVSLRPGTEVTVDHPQVDICFVFDTTGSMSDKIDGLIACMTDFVDKLAELGLDWRTTCVPFGDLTVAGDRVDSHLPFVSSAHAAKQQLRTMPRFSGGGNLGESSIEAIFAAIGKPWRQAAVRVLVVLTDEPALGAHQEQEVLARLRLAEAICFCASPDLAYFRHWAESNGGSWLAIGPTMDTAALLELLRSLVREVASVAANVHALAGGSVRKYLELTSGFAPE